MVDRPSAAERFKAMTRQGGRLEAKLSRMMGAGRRVLYRRQQHGWLHACV